MKWLMLAGCVVVGLAAFGGAMAVMGLLTPKSHVVARRAVYRASREEVWRAIAEVEGYPGWRKDVKRVERLTDREGRAVWREAGGQGEIVFERVEAVAGERMVVRIADPGLPFGGTWTYELAAVEGGTELRITERGEIYNPVFRFMSRFFDLGATIEGVMKSLGKKFGEEIVPVPDGA